jgi:hypothetical protein
MRVASVLLLLAMISACVSTEVPTESMSTDYPDDLGVDTGAVDFDEDWRAVRYDMQFVESAL